MLTRRIAMQMFMAGVVPARLPGAVAPPTRWQRRAQQKQELVKDIVWTTHEPIIFLLRRGGHSDDEVERYQRMYDPENLKRMAAADVRYGMLFFYKGFGLEYERPGMEQSRRAADIMHKLGMKVSLYNAGTMFTETLYREAPEAKNWEQRDQNDHWVPYGIQTFRHYACPNEPAYREYLKRIVKIGIEELHADEISFDNMMLQPEPKSCRCPRCIRAFHEFLRRRYPTKEVMMRRFGLPDPDWVQVNEWDPPTQPDGLAALNDPVLQEWVRFRCESLANHANALHDYVKSLNPDVVFHLNIKGVYSFNRYWTNAVYHPLFAGHVDAIAFDTGGYDARVDPSTGALVSQIRSFKMARRLGISCEERLQDELAAAVHMAFGHEIAVKGYPGAPYINGTHAVFTPIMEFFREYVQRYYTGTDNVADVAVLRNWPSMAYSINAAYVPATLMEQVLIQYKVPFDLLFDEQLDRIGRYKAVVLAGQECVSNSQAQMLLKYVRGGGTLVLAGNTAEYNEWREKRHANPFLPARSEGKGRIVYIPKIIRADVNSTEASGSEDPEPGDPASKTEWKKATRGARNSKAGGNEDPEPGASSSKVERMSPAQWVLPKNHGEIYQAIADGIPKGLSITTEAPLTTVMELVTRKVTHETMVHFVNFDRQTAVPAFQVSMRKQFPGRVKTVTCFSPDADDSASLQFQESGDQVRFSVPTTRLYSMIVIAQ